MDSYSQLEVLYLHGNEISDIPSDWRKWSRLKYIQLHKNKLTNVSLLQLPESMVIIDLSGNKVKPASGSTLDPRIIID
jgi:Leucine-rich repeat (LRR) protein